MKHAGRGYNIFCYEVYIVVVHKTGNDATRIYSQDMVNPRDIENVPCMEYYNYTDTATVPSSPGNNAVCSMFMSGSQAYRHRALL